MSYDLRLCVKTERGNFVLTYVQPEYASPTYNLGKIFRESMGWDFEQGKEYRVDNVINKIVKGIGELTYFPERYKKYEPDNGWGSVEGALEDLLSLARAIEDSDIALDELYVRW